MRLDFTEFNSAAMSQRSAEFCQHMIRRRTVRDFDSRPVPDDVVDNALRVACSAPSGANRQPWRFVVVRDPATKSNIREAAEAEEREFYRGRAPDDWLHALGTARNGRTQAIPRDRPGSDRDLSRTLRCHRRWRARKELLHARVSGHRHRISDCRFTSCRSSHVDAHAESYGVPERNPRPTQPGATILAACCGLSSTFGGSARYREATVRICRQVSLRRLSKLLPIPQSGLLSQNSHKYQDGHRPVRSPAFAFFEHVSGFAKQRSDGALKPSVADRENVWSFQPEDEEHLCGPATNAGNVCKDVDDLLVWKRRHMVEIDLPFVSASRKRFQVFGLRTGQAGGSQVGVGCCEESCRFHVSHGDFDSLADRVRRFVG